ncbi:MAG TPA: ATP-binding protein [Gemmatimonadaceae bacterium]|nr:ATP-binding protein [Gemmatimonadaceae bacterium]
MDREIDLGQFADDVRSIGERARALRKVADRDREAAALPATTLQLTKAVEELQVAEEELRQQNEALLETRAQLESERARYQDLFEEAPDGYVITDALGTIREANRAAAVALGVEPRFLVGKPLSVFVHESSLRDFRRALNAPSGDARADLSVQLHPRRGPDFDAALSVSRTLQGPSAGLVRWLLRDITARRRAEAQLAQLAAELERRVEERTGQLGAALHVQSELLRREQEARAAAERTRERMAFLAAASSALAEVPSYEALLTLAPRLAVPAIADWCVVHLGTSADAVRHAAAAHADPDKERLACELWRQFPLPPSSSFGYAAVIRSGRSELAPSVGLFAGATREAEYVRVLARLGMHAAMCVPLITRKGVVGALTLVSAESGRQFGPEDLAQAEDFAGRVATAIESARLYHEAQAANRAKADFLAVMSHELRTPLAAVIGYAELLETEVTGPLTADQREQCLRIGASAAHLLTLIEQILGYARLEAGHEELHAEQTELGDLIRVVAALIEPLARRKGLRFDVSTPPEGMAAMVDPLKLRQVLINLLSNAVKFTDAGRVAIELRREGAWVCIGVSDTGPGIAAADRERIFEPFIQLGEVTTSRGQGTGLGLSVVRRYARLHGGDVRVRDAEGGGTRFTVELPLVPTAVIPAQLAGATAPPASAPASIGPAAA